MKKINLTVLFISLISQSFAFATSDYERYKGYFCKNGSHSVESVIISCAQIDPNPKIEAGKEISQILEQTIKQDFKEFCGNPDLQQGKIKGYSDQKDIIPFPPDECSCDLRRKVTQRLFCEQSPEDQEKISQKYKANYILSFIESSEFVECSNIKEEATLCGSDESQNTIAYILENYSFVERYQVIHNKVKSFQSSSEIKLCPEGSPSKSFCEVLNSDTKTFAEKYQLNEYFFSKVDLKTGKDKTDESLRNLKTFSCLNYNEERDNQERQEESSVLSFRSAQGKQFGFSEVPTDPAKIVELENKHNIKIEEDDTPFVLNRKIAIAEHKKQYEKDLIQTTKIAAELNSLIDKLAKTKDPVKRKEIFSRLHELKKEIRKIAKTVPQKKNLSEILDIEKDYPEEVKKYYAEVERENHKNIPSIKNTISDNFKSTSSKAKESSTPYEPFYNKKAPKREINIVPERSKSKDESKAEKLKRSENRKLSIAATFDDDSTSSSTTGPKRSRTPASTTKALSLMSYNIPSKAKEPEVINNSDKPKIKIVFINDQKVMKVFKLEDKGYELKDEISKDDFVENFDSFPELVKEQGREFFELKNLNEVISE